MAVATQTQFTRPEEITEYFLDELRSHATVLELGFVGAYGEKLVPEYPAVVVSAGPTDKEVHGTHTYLVTLRCFFFVYHSALTRTHASRSLQDLELATRIVDFLERDLTLGGAIIHGHVESEVPGASQLNANKSGIVISTRLAWEGISERRF